MDLTQATHSYVERMVNTNAVAPANGRHDMRKVAGTTAGGKIKILLLDKETVSIVWNF